MGKDMLLAIDIGNTNFTVGVFRERELLATFRITTKLQRTSDEYGIVFIELIRTRGLSPADIEDVIISSVVPNVMHSVVNAMKKYFNRQQAELGRINGFVQEMMAGQKVEKVFNHEKENFKEFCEMNERFAGSLQMHWHIQVCSCR